MPKKKSEGTKITNIPKKNDKTEGQAEKENKLSSLKWEELEKYIEQPLWDSREKRWRILDGYKRMQNTYSITFSDIADWVSFFDRNLYLEEVK